MQQLPCPALATPHPLQPYASLPSTPRPPTPLAIVLYCPTVLLQGKQYGDIAVQSALDDNLVSCALNVSPSPPSIHPPPLHTAHN